MRNLNGKRRCMKRRFVAYTQIQSYGRHIRTAIRRADG